MEFDRRRRGIAAANVQGGMRMVALQSAIGRHWTASAMAMVLGLAATPMASATDYTVLTSGQPSGAMSVVEAPGGREISFRFNDRGRGPEVRSVVTVDSDLLPVNLSIDGVDYYKLAVSEHFKQAGPAATWRAANDSGTVKAAGFYLPSETTPEHLSMLARALLRSPGHRIPLLPSGEARLEPLIERPIDIGGTPAVARLFALQGLGYEARPIWLDAHGELLMQGNAWFATVRHGMEAQAEGLIRAQAEALEKRDLARSSALMRRPSGPVMFRNVSLFDAVARVTRANMTVIVDGSRIVAVGQNGETAAPPGATVIDGTGKTLLPGLWDMHVHLATNSDGLLHLAAGVTSVRDLANTMEDTLLRKRRFETGELPGPRMVLAGFIDGPGPLSGPIKVLVSTPEEMRAAIRTYAARGYEQIKLYSSLDPALVPVAALEAHRLGLRLSGHVPAGMTMRQAVAAGFDEVHHLNFTALNFMSADINAKTNGITRITAIAEHAWEIDPGSPKVREFIAFLKAKGTVVDPTMSLYESDLLGRPGTPAPNLAADIDRLPPVVRRAAYGAGLARGEKEVVRNAASFRTMSGLLKALYDGGVPLVAGTDDTPGFTYHRELELYQKAGIPAADVLYIATLGAARVAGREAELGSVSPGKLADLILVDGNPTASVSDLRKTVLVMKDGVLFQPDTLLSEVGVGPAAK
ncbi:amidohydrolase family protein [Sphingomonas sp. ERG5]|uniref:amidohydrolase family protein n=1 Tax=Sphingomonas sp. ERG5 TaxID=1381597 RepID=UPI001F3243A0|nr:amidohydrolase family protein [Sphingomonas sp. ERG5]